MIDFSIPYSIYKMALTVRLVLTLRSSSITASHIRLDIQYLRHASHKPAMQRGWQLRLAIKHHLRRESATPSGGKISHWSSLHKPAICTPVATKSLLTMPWNPLSQIVSHLISAWRTVVESARTTFDGLLLGDGNNVDWNGIELFWLLAFV